MALIYESIRTIVINIMPEPCYLTAPSGIKAVRLKFLLRFC